MPIFPGENREGMALKIWAEQGHSFRFIDALIFRDSLV
jgi:hypothetical protein